MSQADIAVVIKIHISVFFACRGDLSTDGDILSMVDVQTKQWTEMMMKQRKEEWEMLKAHLTVQVTKA